MRKLIFATILIILPLSIIGGVAYYAKYLIYDWQYRGPETTFTIKKGEGFASINHRLAKQGLISSPRALHHYAKYQHLLTQFRNGKFLIRSNINMIELLDIFLKEQPILPKINIPEGKNMFEIANTLESLGITNRKDFLQAARDRSFLTELGIIGERVEGYLFPNTYTFEEEMPAKKIIQAMVREFFRKVSELDIDLSPEQLHRVVTLASIVEKETGAKAERPRIAGVFLNRLTKNMRLQSDPTTIYGIYETFNGNLRKTHLSEKTPYNTYAISGLPIGPICNPGLEAIQAVLRPEKHEYLFFVSQNDGTHVFSKNYRDHAKAVDEYQKNIKNRQGKSWRDLKQ